ncbi:hypothetical protein BC831DRAFT_474826 [Entophlyctis helioformis]|nr:hypothetical protein BC831DRAFT_474826 [Entophlyctis helioformis]
MGNRHSKQHAAALAEAAEQASAAASAAAQSQTPITLSSFTPRKLLGKGNFAKVVLVEHKATGTLYALKYSKKIKARLENKVHHIVEERNLLEEVCHTYISQLRYSFQDDLCLYMVLDYIDGGDLRSHMKNRTWSEKEARIVVCEVASALTYLHNRLIVHRDIKPENVLLDKAGHAYVSDFNVAIRQTPGTPIRSMAGTEPYMAPEILNRIGYFAAVDWWSLGVVLFELVYGERPFRTRNRRELIKRGTFSFPYRLPLISDVCQDAIARFMMMEPSQRMGFGEIGYSLMRAHPFFIDISWFAVDRKEQAPVYIPASMANNALTVPSVVPGGGGGGSSSGVHGGGTSANLVVPATAAANVPPPTSPGGAGASDAGSPAVKSGAGGVPGFEMDMFDEDIERMLKDPTNNMSSEGNDTASDVVEEFLYYDFDLHNGRSVEQLAADTRGLARTKISSPVSDCELPDHINSFHGTTNTSYVVPGSRRPSFTAASVRQRRASVASTHSPVTASGSRDLAANSTSAGGTGRHSDHLSSITKLFKGLGSRRRSKGQSDYFNQGELSTTGTPTVMSASAGVSSTGQGAGGLNTSGGGINVANGGAGGNAYNGGTQARRRSRRFSETESSTATRGQLDHVGSVPGVASLVLQQQLQLLHLQAQAQTQAQRHSIATPAFRIRRMDSAAMTSSEGLHHQGATVLAPISTSNMPPQYGLSPHSSMSPIPAAQYAQQSQPQLPSPPVANSQMALMHMLQLQAAAVASSSSGNNNQPNANGAAHSMQDTYPAQAYARRPSFPQSLPSQPPSHSPSPPITRHAGGLGSNDSGGSSKLDANAPYDLSALQQLHYQLQLQQQQSAAAGMPTGMAPAAPPSGARYAYGPGGNATAGSGQSSMMGSSGLGNSRPVMVHGPTAGVQHGQMQGPAEQSMRPRRISEGMPPGVYAAAGMSRNNSNVSNDYGQPVSGHGRRLSSGATHLAVLGRAVPAGRRHSFGSSSGAS